MDKYTEIRELTNQIKRLEMIPTFEVGSIYYNDEDDGDEFICLENKMGTRIDTLVTKRQGKYKDKELTGRVMTINQFWQSYIEPQVKEAKDRIKTLLG